MGRSLDDYLAEEGQLAEAEAVASKRVLAFQIAKLMAEQQLSKAEMARRMSTEPLWRLIGCWTTTRNRRPW